MSFCSLYNVISENYIEQYFFVLCGEEGVASNDLMPFGFSL